MFLLTLSMILSFSFIFLSHPLTFGLLLLLQTMIVALMTGMLNYNFWFSYILFLIMVGGMLILFIYMTSVASNEPFKFSIKISSLLLILIPVSLISIFMDKLYNSMKFLNYELEKVNASNNLSLSKYVNEPSNMILLMVILYLLITLIMAVKIVSNHKGPLRQMF